MIRVTLKGLMWRKARAVLTGVAVILGVAMISGTFVLTDTIAKAFDTIFSSSYKQTSAVITGRQVVKNSVSGNATIPSSLLARGRQLPDVDRAAGAIFDINANSNLAKLIDKKGKAISHDAPSFAFGFDPDDAQFNPMQIVEGRWASGPTEVVLDKGTAKKYHFAVGDDVRVSAQGAARSYSVVGTAKFGSVDSLGGATIAIFTVPAAQKLLHKEDQYDLIYLAAAQGVSADRLVSQVKPLLPASVEVRTGAEQAKANAHDTKEFTKIIQQALLAFGGIALFVGAFVIFNTLSITVAQRIREFATLRTLGASRRQVLRSVLLEGLAIGVFASLTGLFLGLLLAKGLNALFSALGGELPQTSLVFAPRTVIVSLTAGILITVLATIGPAVKATRVPPISAVREGSTLPPSRFTAYAPAVAVMTILGAIFALGVGMFVGGIGTPQRLFMLGAGVMGLFVGVALVAGRLVRPIAAVVGIPARKLGGTPGRLAAGNATRNPARTASTAAALMIGLALVTVVATLGQGLRESDKNALRHQVRSHYVVTSKNGFDPFPVGAGLALKNVAGVTTVSSVRDDKARVLGDNARVDGINPATIEQTFHFDWDKGSSQAIKTLAVDRAIVRKKFADKHGLEAGDIFRMTTPAGRHLVYQVAGIYRPRKIDSLDPILGSILISQQAFDQTFPRPKNLLTFVNVDGGVSEETTAKLKSALAAPYPDAKVQSRSDWVEDRSSGIGQLLNMLYVLLALSVIVSLVGMVNTLVLSVFERTREVGMLRAVGMTRRQTRRMVRHESVITALIGATLGLPIGIFLAALVTRGLSEQGVSFALPIVPLIVFAIVAVIAGVLAAVAPARRAARLNVLQALQYE